MSQLTLTSIGSDNGLALNNRQAIMWTYDDLIYWCLNASLVLNEWTQQVIIKYIPLHRIVLKNIQVFDINSYFQN